MVNFHNSLIQVLIRNPAIRSSQKLHVMLLSTKTLHRFLAIILTIIFLTISLTILTILYNNYCILVMLRIILYKILTNYSTFLFILIFIWTQYKNVYVLLYLTSSDYITFVRFIHLLHVVMDNSSIHRILLCLWAVVTYLFCYKSEFSLSFSSCKSDICKDIIT